MLDNNYTEVTSSKYGKSYELTYSFTVGPARYQGKDTVYKLPEAQEQTVYYDPKNPNENSLNSSSADGRKIIAALVLLVVAIIAYGTLPIRPDAGVPSDPQGGGIGDAAGEHLSMPGGKYPATMYVGIAFFGQVAFVSSMFASAAAFVGPGQLVRDLMVCLAILIGTGSTLWIYWDRWKCASMYCSPLCSGCANISILYVPIAAFFYANWRGILKFAGR
jgi:hypothetical protein